MPQPDDKAQQRAHRIRRRYVEKRKRIKWLCEELDRLVFKAESKPKGSKFIPILMGEAEKVREELRRLDH